MKIKSISDVITNSSSEVFVVKSDKKSGIELKDFIQEHCKDCLWDGAYELERIPKGLKWIFTDEMIEIIKENCNETSGVGGECEIYTWEDAFRMYKELHNLPKLTPEQWARKLDYPLEELQKIAVVDIDRACRATINMMEQEFTVLEDEDEFFDRNFRFCY